MTDAIAQLVKDAVPIYDYVSRFVKLTKTGSYYTGLSPFKTERTPSFTITPRLGIYKCFSTGKSGDVITFCQEMEGLAFPEALKRLAQFGNIRLPENNKPVELPAEQKISPVNEAAAKFFAIALKHNVKAIEFLKARGVSGQSAKDFKIGYAPGESAFTSASGFPLDYLLLSNLTRQDNTGTAYDFFRDRIMFPIHSPTGKIIGFAGRSLASAKPKYLNTSNSPLYQKAQTLFGLYHSRDAIRQKKYVIVVEGYMDVIMLHQYGIKNVVAVSGTAFTPDQAHIIKQFCELAIFMFDGDEAGRNAATKSVLVALKSGLHSKVTLTPEPYDPDEFVRTYGADAVETLLTGTDTLEGIQHLAKTVADQHDPAAKTEALYSIVDSLSDITDKPTRVAAIKELALACGVDAHDLHRRDAKNQYRKQQPETHIPALLPEQYDKLPTTETYLVAACHHSKEALEFVASHHSANVFLSPVTRGIFESLLEGKELSPYQTSVIQAVWEWASNTNLLPENFMRSVKSALFQQRIVWTNNLQATVSAQLYACKPEDETKKNELMLKLELVHNMQHQLSTTTATEMFA